MVFAIPELNTDMHFLPANKNRSIQAIRGRKVFSILNELSKADRCIGNTRNNYEDSMMMLVSMNKTKISKLHLHEQPLYSQNTYHYIW